MRVKTFRWFTTILFISLLGLALGGCGGSSSSNDPPPDPTTGTISGTVAGTEIVAVDVDGAIVARDDTTGKEPDPDTGNFDFTLTGIPVGVSIRVYLITDSGVYPLYFDSTGGSGAADTNVFSLSTVATIDLGFVDTTAVPGQAIPWNNPVAVAGVNAEAENTATPVLPGGTLTVNVTDENSGLPLSGTTVIVDHASDPRQIDTTTAGTVSFTTPSGGPVTVTIGMSGYEIMTLIDSNIATLGDMVLKPMGLSAFIQGTVSNYTVGGFIERAFMSNGNWYGDWLDECPTCEELWDGTPGFYREGVSLPNRQYAYSVFDGAWWNNTTPTNFVAATGIGPLTDGQTLTVDLTFPITPPAATTTTGTIIVPASLGTIEEVAAFGLSDLGDQGGLNVGFSPWGTTSPYSYTLTTFEYTGGTSDDIAVSAEGPGGESFAIRRGVGFGGTGVDFNLIDIPTNLSPRSGTCGGGIAPSFSWTGVTGTSLYIVDLNDSDTKWWVVTDGSSTGFTLPDLTGTALTALGLSPGVPVDWSVRTIMAPGYRFKTIDENTMLRIITDHSVSAGVSCTP